jgi:hypothetical protein
MKIILLIIINIQTNEITWKNVILEKMRERIIEFGVHMSEKYQLQILIPD